MPLTYLAFFCLTLACYITEADCQDRCRIMFYNTENLFDVIDNPVTDDDAFTPQGDMHWTSGRYYRKLNNISKVIVTVGEWHPPDLIGLCEIENRGVLNDLVGNTPLSKFGYRFIHKDSHDRRGMDVALLFNPETVQVLASRYLSIDTAIVITRDILYTRVRIQNDTIDLFVNHWPSRSSGQLETEKGRLAAAKVVKEIADSILSQNHSANIVIMGDLNDDPVDESLVVLIPTPPGWGDPGGVGLYNLTTVPERGAVRGTLKYQGSWNIFDQILVSGGMLKSKLIKPDSYHICMNPFLLEPDVTYNGVKPFRTYTGFKYHGGFSDHLPVYIDVFLEN